MKTKELLKKLRGVQTISSIMSNLNINRQKAIYYIHRLKKQEYVKTKRQSNKTRIYTISFENKLKSSTPEEIINLSSPIKISSSNIYRVIGRKITPEEALIYSVKTGDFRKILASLSLFKKIKNWKLLYQLAKQNNLKKEICALYDLSKQIQKTRKIPKIFINNSIPKKTEKYKYLIPNLKSKDYKEIQKKWRVYLPFNKKDLEVYQDDIN